MGCRVFMDGGGIVERSSQVRRIMRRKMEKDHIFLKTLQPPIKTNKELI